MPTTADGRLSAVIDFERLGIGDATWARGRGWALADDIIAYAGYGAAGLRVAAQTTRQITAVLADRPGSGR